jgi:hypothetical protein
MPSTRTLPETPVRTRPDTMPWTERYTDPERICPQQRRETSSPDIEP